MNWFKENKFLAGFLAVMVVGVGALGFLLLGAKGQYEEALASYQEKASELSRLQKQPIFPNQKNLDKLLEQKKQATVEATKFGQALLAQQVPAEEMSPAQFQDKLKAAVNAIKAKAVQSAPPVKLPDKFFLGFDKYETAPPDPAAAVSLGRQLKVIEWTIGKLIETRVTEIKTLERTELPEEKGKADDKKATPGKGERATKVGVRKNPFEVSFLAEQGSFKQALNAIIDYKGQFLIPRLITVKNESDKGPPRAAAGAIAFDPNIAAAAAAPVTPPATNPDGTPVVAPPAPVPAIPGAVAPATGTPPATYIVGDEKVEARLIIEAVEFTEVAAK